MIWVVLYIMMIFVTAYILSRFVAGSRNEERGAIVAALFWPLGKHRSKHRSKK